MNSRKLNEDRGFTLIELLAVIIILGVIMLQKDVITRLISNEGTKD